MDALDGRRGDGARENNSSGSSLATVPTTTHVHAAFEVTSHEQTSQVVTRTMVNL
jgi:hypothetical protein